jgi:hypothetical protein
MIIIVKRAPRNKPPSPATIRRAKPDTCILSKLLQREHPLNLAHQIIPPIKTTFAKTTTSLFFTQ